jgi:S1-C subfamily serine protease
MTTLREDRQRLHPLARIAFILSLLGIPLVGLVLGPIAVVLAGMALGQISTNSLLRGRAMAMAAVVIGVGDIVLWVAILGLIIPSANLPVFRRTERLMFPSGGLTDRAPAHIKQALENNVFFLVKKQNRPSFLNAETFSGSGVILGKEDGTHLIITNRHVVDPAFNGTDTTAAPAANATPSITAYFSDGTKSAAHVWWVAPGGADLALVATGSQPETVTIPRYVPLQPISIGDKVFTVGNPHELAWSYNEGIISAIREITMANGRLTIFQTQTPINEGNSGGGLYSQDGTLIGIVTWTKDKSQTEGISFAIAYTGFLKLFDDS